MKNIIVFLSLSLSVNYFSQCEINTSASQMTITCGESANLSAFGSSTGSVILNENFNSGSFGPGWGTTPGAVNFNNPPCAGSGPDGTTYAWMDNNTSVPRTLTSQSYNLTGATAGVSICFDLLFAEQGNNAPCEGPDEPDEGVYLQYSTDGGATWVDIHYFDPNGGNDPQLTNWNNWCFTIPAGAITSNTMFRWHQIADSGADYDHWGIDNVQIFQNDINAEIEWLHDGYSYGVGNPGGVNPNAVTPTTTTTYTAQITTGTGAVCTSNITITVIPPVYDVNVVANPTTVCVGNCSNITGSAQIVDDPGGLETYENNEFDLVLLGNASVNINVQGINTNNITNGLIDNVTINGFNFSGSWICNGPIITIIPPTFGTCNCNGTQINNLATCNLNTNGFTVTLTAPGGCDIILVPSGVANGNYNNTVFVPIGGSAFGGTFPNGGTWNPNEPFSGLNGCNPNGVWTLTFSSPGIGIGAGTLTGWSITFNDPPIYQPVNATWSPTAGLSSTNTVNTTACPTNTTTYTLTLDNGTPGCPTHTENVTITVDPCGGCIPPTFTVTNPPAFCLPGTYNLTSAVSGTGANIVTYHLTNADATGDVNPMASTVVSTAGTYFVRVEDPTDPTCFSVQSITVTATPLANSTFSFANFCASAANGPTGIFTPGGTFSFNPAPTDGASINSATGSISNATNNTYTVQYTTSGSCPTSSTQNVTSTSLVLNITTIGENCGAVDGQISIVASNGTPNYSYSIDNGISFQTNGDFTNLNSGNYPIQVVDNNGCIANQNTTVLAVGGPTIDNIIETNPSCTGLCDGSLEAQVSGGTPPYSYQWFDNAGNPVGTNSSIITGLCAGNYSVEVTDANSTTTNTILNTNTSFENGITGGCNCPTDYVCNNDAGIVYDGIDPVYVVGNTGCVSDANNYTNSLGANSGSGYVYFYAGADNITSQSINFAGGETVEICVYYAGPQGASASGQNTANCNFKFGIDGVAVSPVTNVPANTGWTQYCFTTIMTAGNHTFSILSGGAAQYSMWFDDFTISIPGIPGSGCSSTDVATLTAPVIDDATFAFADFCHDQVNGPTGIVTPGGTFSFNPTPGDGASIDPTNGVISNATATASYTVQYATNGACPATSTQSVTANDCSSCTPPTFTVTNPAAVCNPATIDLTTTVSGVGANIASYHATNADATAGTNALASTNVATSGTYFIRVEDANDPTCFTVQSVDVTINAVEDATFAFADFCHDQVNGPTGIVTPGGTFSFNPTPGDGSSIDPTTGVISNATATASYTVQYATNGACPATSTLNVTANDCSSCTPPTFTVTNPAAVCNPATINLTTTVSGVGANITSYHATNADATAGTNALASTNVATSGTYFIRLEDANDPTCFTVQSVDITVHPAITLSSIVIPTNCGLPNGSIDLTVLTGSGNYTYIWSNGQQAEDLSNLNSGNYLVNVTDVLSNCNASLSVTINPSSAPYANFSMSPGSMVIPDHESQSINLSVGASNYEWTVSGPNFTYTSNLENISLDLPIDTGHYEVCLMAFNDPTCADTICKFVEVRDEFIIYVPNTFTPDGDEYNNEFKPVISLVDLQNYDFFIFNRWGELIFESHDLDYGWDGTYNGKSVQEGVYTWKIGLKSLYTDEHRIYTGHVTKLK